MTLGETKGLQSYIGINIGAFLASILVGFIGEVYGWHYGFSLAGFSVLDKLHLFQVKIN